MKWTRWKDGHSDLMVDGGNKARIYRCIQIKQVASGIHRCVRITRGDKDKVYAWWAGAGATYQTGWSIFAEDARKACEAIVAEEQRCKPK